ncbi:hypothetical protein CRENBAI_014398 [Crenichthys baileyi]|uniref:Uncharacterized protein n=1 Tax=Crenichthys baileyi TaxID=28760 RepID=A0AAV9RRL9_9TELE
MNPAAASEVTPPPGGPDCTMQLGSAVRVIVQQLQPTWRAALCLLSAGVSACSPHCTQFCTSAHWTGQPCTALRCSGNRLSTQLPQQTIPNIIFMHIEYSSSRKLPGESSVPNNTHAELK